MGTNALFVDEPKPIGNSEGSDGRWQLHVKSFPSGAPDPGSYNAITCTQVNANTVAYEFRSGGISGTIVQTVTIDYGTPTAIPFVSTLYT